MSARLAVSKAMAVRGKVALVTGAGSGMGREMTLELVKRGARVAAVDLHANTLEETKKLGGSGVATFAMDVTNRDKIAKLPEDIHKALGDVDIVINNAGIVHPFAKMNDLPFSTAMRVMDVNFNAPFFIIKTFLPGLLKRPQGYILNVGSMASFIPVPGLSAYCASKGALKMMTEELRTELSDTNIGVTIAFPGSIDTNIMANSEVTLNPAGTEVMTAMKGLPATTAAKIMIDAIESGDPRVTVGEDATYLDYMSRCRPVFAADTLYQQMKNLV